MKQAEGDLSHVISGWLAGSGGTRGKWFEDTSPPGLAPARWRQHITKHRGPRSNRSWRNL